MDLPILDGVRFEEKIVFVRGDLDIDHTTLSGNVRFESLLKTLTMILSKNPRKVVLVGHKGRPKGAYNENLSLLPLVDILKEKFDQDVFFVSFDMFNGDFKGTFENAHQKLYLLENVRFWEGEELNDFGFRDKFRDFTPDVYVNAAFASSHREHTSIVGIPALVKEKYVGLRFAEEVEKLSSLFDDPKKPVISIISGVKEDKLKYIDDFKKFSDKVLVAGRLPDYMPDPDEMKLDGGLVVARLLPDKEDITMRSVESFEKEIEKAGTIVLAGPVGKYEEEGHSQGTVRVFNAIADSSAYKIAGGGDTAKALDLLGLTNKFDWVSVGGGSALEFLAKRTLAGIEAII